ncbi:MAG: AI-2E family transporter [Acidobacteriota bacterium]
MNSSPLTQRHLARRFFLGGLIAAVALLVYTVRAFLIPIVLAAVFATLFQPLYRALLRLTPRRRAVAALLSCFILLLGLLLPLYGVVFLIADEALDVYAQIEAKMQLLLAGPDPALLRDIQATPWYTQLHLDRVNWAQVTSGVLQGLGNAATALISRSSRGTLQALIMLAVTLFTMFYFFVDGEKLVARLKFLSPLAERHENAIIERFVSVARATVAGTFVIAALQALLGGVTLAICGVKAPVLWALVMLFLAFIPAFGVKLVLVPIALVQLLTGEVWQGVTILLVSFLVILNVDNLLRPRLVGSRSGLHDLVVFFSTLGGLATFGVTGIIVGPVIAAFVQSMLEIYVEEFGPELAMREAPLAGVPLSRPAAANLPDESRAEAPVRRD